MPIYEYRCAACGASFDRLLRIGAQAPACPECGYAGTERVISLVASRSGGADGGGAACATGG